MHDAATGTGFPKTPVNDAKIVGRGFWKTTIEMNQVSERVISLNKIQSKHIFIFIAIGVLYFAGISAILYPMISNVFSLRNSRTIIADYAEEVKEMNTSDIDEIIAKVTQHNQNLTKRIYDDGLEMSLCNDKGLMCYVDIPSIGVYLPVYYGTSEEVLAIGCGHLENTSLPIGGESTHSVISAHTGLPSADMFTKLDQVKMGETFYIHVLNRVLAYKVNKIKVVYPYNVEELGIVEGKDYMTLLTCTPYGINDKRLLVRGTRIPYEPESKKPETEIIHQTDSSVVDKGLQEKINNQLTVIYVIAGAAVALYIAAFFWMIVSLRAKEKKDADEQNVNSKTN